VLRRRQPGGWRGARVRGLVGESGAGKSMLGACRASACLPAKRRDWPRYDFDSRGPRSLGDGGAGATQSVGAAAIRADSRRDPMTSLNPVSSGSGPQIAVMLRASFWRSVETCRAGLGGARSSFSRGRRSRSVNRGGCWSLYPHENLRRDAAQRGLDRDGVLPAIRASSLPTRPTTALDVTVQRQVAANWFERLRQRHGRGDPVHHARNLGRGSRKICRTMTVAACRGACLEEGRDGRLCWQSRRHPYNPRVCWRRRRRARSARPRPLRPVTTFIDRKPLGRKSAIGWTALPSAGPAMSERSCLRTSPF